MDSSTAVTAHPGFVEVIKNLSPDEARIMSFFQMEKQMPIVDIRAHMKEKPMEFQTVFQNFSHVGKVAGCEHLMLVPAYVDNLYRLQLLEIQTMTQIAALNAYKEIEEDRELESVRQMIVGTGRTIQFNRKILNRTVWGRLFCSACVIKKPRSSP
jgi:hypothetical protein